MKAAWIALVCGLAAHALAWAACVFLLFDTDGYGQTLLESNGMHVIWALLFPVLLTGIALAATLLTHVPGALRLFMTWGPAGVLLGFCLLTGFSIGLWYLPAGVALIAAAVADLDRKASLTDA